MASGNLLGGRVYPQTLRANSSLACRRPSGRQDSAELPVARPGLPEIAGRQGAEQLLQGGVRRRRGVEPDRDERSDQCRDLQE